MKNVPVLFCIIFSAFGCNNNAKEIDKVTDNRIALRADTLNTVKLTDTMVIFESTCRGCAYEASTNFAISDSMNIVRLDDIVTIDNSPPDMDGGSISKDLVLVPVKPGITDIKLYKFLRQEKSKEDSARFTTYKIEVKQ